MTDICTEFESDPRLHADHPDNGVLFARRSTTMAPAFEQAARLLEPHLRLLKVNAETEQALAGVHGIRSIPTLVLFTGGREVKRVSGAMDARHIVNWARE